MTALQSSCPVVTHLHNLPPMNQDHKQPTKRQSTVELDPLASADVYYGESHRKKAGARHRTYSVVVPTSHFQDTAFPIATRNRRGSHDETSYPRMFQIEVEPTLKALLRSEDTDNNFQITIEDTGPKTLSVGTARSNGHKKIEIRGAYCLANLLQELYLAKDYGRKKITLHEARLHENPVNRLERLVRTQFWEGLTRRMDGSNIEIVGRDPKDWTADPRPRIYVPRGAPEQYEYYTKIAKENPTIRLDVQWLPENCDDPVFVRDLNQKPGILALAMEEYTTPDGKKDLRGLPFIVPGGRFNELYGWDSYMISIGLMINNRVSLVKSMVDHFTFCIQHYGKILNANRSYYLCRSQPPFMTQMVLMVYNRIKHEKGAKEWLRTGILAAIKEYYSVWMAKPRIDPVTGLSRYRPGGLGVPPETEASHFVHVLEPYAEKHGMTFEEFVHAYNHQQVIEPELDEYFLHDRAVRESGHDTSYRLENVCANLATVDLNSLLFKYELDIEECIRTEFNDQLEIPNNWLTKRFKPGHIERSAVWKNRAARRRVLMNKFMWNESAGMYFDYDTVKKERTVYESATTFWPMWAGIPTPRQAAVLVENALPKFEAFGGLVSGSEESRGIVGLDRPNRQWDYPFGWAPQQMLAWGGLRKYGFEFEAERLAYRWLYMIIKAFVDYNGVVVEKYDVTRQIDPHKVDAEYGNQGADFIGVPREGFGWVNASFVFGLSFLGSHMRRALGTCTPWTDFDKATDIALEEADGFFDEFKLDDDDPISTTSTSP